MLPHSFEKRNGFVVVEISDAASQKKNEYSIGASPVLTQAGKAFEIRGSEGMNLDASNPAQVFATALERNVRNVDCKIDYIVLLRRNRFEHALGLQTVAASEFDDG